MMPDTFKQKTPSQSQIDRMEIFRGDMAALAEKAEQTVNPGRYHSLFHTKLEEAAMWLNKAITFDGLKSDGS
jgi:hypothetical protein